MESAIDKRIQNSVLAAVSFTTFIFSLALYLSDKFLFQRFIGNINPLLAIMLIILLSFGIFYFFLRHHWFRVYKAGDLIGKTYYIGFAFVLAIIMIFIDTEIIFPRDLNILFPKSLLFYPVIAFFVEIVFHVIPITILLFALSGLFKNTDHKILAWVCIVVVAFIEPVYHVVNMASTHSYPNWALIYIGFHIYLINFLQLYLFRRYDFITMFSFRLMYYLIWHIGWGYLRLKWLV